MPDDPALGHPETPQGPTAGETPRTAPERRRWSLGRDVVAPEPEGDDEAGARNDSEEAGARDDGEEAEARNDGEEAGARNESGTPNQSETRGDDAAGGGGEARGGDAFAPDDNRGEARGGAFAPDDNRGEADGGAFAADDARGDGRGDDAFALDDGHMPVGSRAGFRLAAFGALLIVVLFAGYGLGRLNSGVASASAPPTGLAAGGGAPMPGMTVNENQPHVHNTDGTVTQGGVAAPMGSAVGGLSLSAGGLTLVPSSTDFVAGKAQRLEFRIVGSGAAAITTYAIVHDKPLHLIVVRRDLSGFQHLHPTMATDGTWGIDLTLADPGIYRMVADFTAVVGGQPLATTLGGDLTVAGQYSPRALPAPGRSDAVDGLTVAYEGKPGIAATQPMLMNVVDAGGKAVALEPYLGAFGHLVVMRQGDLAYVHVHPETQLADGKVKFWLAMPSAGRYRMFFDFQVAGQVHTAEWTAAVS